MEIVYFILVAVGAWIFGVFGWAQIIGALQNLSTRGPKMLITLLIWLVIIGTTLFLILKFLPAKIWAWVIGMVVSLVLVLLQGKVE